MVSLPNIETVISFFCNILGWYSYSLRGLAARLAGAALPRGFLCLILAFLPDVSTMRPETEDQFPLIGVYLSIRQNISKSSRAPARLHLTEVLTRLELITLLLYAI